MDDSQLQTRSELEARAQGYEWSADSRSSASAKLKATLASVDLYMRALRIAETSQDRQRLNLKCKNLITQAEGLRLQKDAAKKRALSDPPVSTRKLTTRENIILLEGSKLNGHLFRQWEKDPKEDEFTLKEAHGLHTDLPYLQLSDTQLKSFGGWKRPNEALGLISITSSSSGQTSTNTPTMSPLEKVDLVQDLTSDCSVVASLCAGTSRMERGHPDISCSTVFPYDHSAKRIAISPNGKYVYRLYFNGCWRRVDIDDLLPTSTNSRLLHVIDRSHPWLLWPALTEKAYLKIRGGYDFPGSNSGTDLAVLTGWIPQQVFLHNDDVEQETLWEELIDAFNDGNIYLTIGTGKLGRREQKQLGLAAEHDYAVLDMKESGLVREMLIKNPWADGDVWKGASRKKPNPSHESYPDLPPVEGSDEMLPGTFWMDFKSVFQYYENLYINWNPALFTKRDDRHFSWLLPQRQPASIIFDSNPQFCISSPKDGEIWLLLNRHFRTGDYTQETNGKNGYISIYLFDKSGFRVLCNDDALKYGLLVDSPNTLLRFDASANTSYTAVVVQQDLPAGKHNFTLSVFSNTNATLTEAPSRYSATSRISSAWTRANSGGNAKSVRYLTNPQCSVTLPSEQRVAFILRTTNESATSITADTTAIPNGSNHKTTAGDSSDINIRLLLCASSGNRITRLRPRDAIAHSGDYRSGICVLEPTQPLPRGRYTLICSTFEQNQQSKFTIDFHSSPSPSNPPSNPPSQSALTATQPLQATITLLTSESSGRLRLTHTLTFTHHPNHHSDNPSTPGTQPSINRLLSPLTIPQTTKCTIVLRQTSRNSTSSFFRVSLEQGQGPYKSVVADSSVDDEEFCAIGMGLWIEEVVLGSQGSGVGRRGLDMGGSGAMAGGVGVGMGVGKGTGGIIGGSGGGDGGLWLVVERLAQGSNSDSTGESQGRHDHWIRPDGLRPMTEVVTVELLVDEKIEVGAWGVGDG